MDTGHGLGQVAELAAEGCRVVDAVVGEHGEAPDRLEHEGHLQRGPAQKQFERAPDRHVLLLVMHHVTAMHGRSISSLTDPTASLRASGGYGTCGSAPACPACSLRLSTRISLCASSISSPPASGAGPRCSPRTWTLPSTRLTWTSGSRCCTATRHGVSGSARPSPPSGPGGGRCTPGPALVLRRLLRSWRLDLVQAHGGEPLKYAALAGMGRPAPIVYRRIGSVSWLASGFRRALYGRLGAACRPGGGRRVGPRRDRGRVRAGPDRGDHPQRGRPGPAGPRLGAGGDQGRPGDRPGRRRGAVAGRADLGEDPGPPGR